MDTESPALSRIPDNEISVWEILAVLLRQRWTIVLTTVIVVAVTLAFVFLRADTYTTQASFRPQGSETSASQLMTLASQFGVTVPGTTGQEASPAFYAELLTSREILSRVAAEGYDIAGVGRVSLAELFEIDEEDKARRDRQTIETLRDEVLSVQTSRETGVVSIEARTDWASLSLEITRRLLDEIARFNLNTRRSQAAAERVFIEERVDSAKHALTEAESAMQAFLQANRRWEDSPDLTFQHDRLERDISLRQQVYTTLVQSFEQARIAEVRDTPVITVLQAPFLPPPDDARVLLLTGLSLVVGGVLGIALAFLVDALRRAPADAARDDFRATWNDLLQTLPFGRRRPV